MDAKTPKSSATTTTLVQPIHAIPPLDAFSLPSVAMTAMDVPSIRAMPLPDALTSRKTAMTATTVPPTHAIHRLSMDASTPAFHAHCAAIPICSHASARTHAIPRHATLPTETVKLSTRSHAMTTMHARSIPALKSTTPSTHVPMFNKFAI